MSSSNEMFFSFSSLTLTKKKINRKNVRFSLHFSFAFLHLNTNKKKFIYADVLSHVREFTVHREEEV